MSEEREELDRLSLEQWCTHVHTTKLLKQFKEKREIALTNLLSACARSQDAAVRAQVETYNRMKEFVIHLQGGDFKKEQASE